MDKVMKDRQLDYLRQIDGWKEEEKIDIQELSLSKVAKNIYIYNTIYMYTKIYKMYYFNVKTSTFWYLWLDCPINDKEGSLQVMIRNLHTKLQHTNDISQFHLVLRLFKEREATL